MTSNSSRADSLIRELLSDPHSFYDSPKLNGLLDEFVRGACLEAIIPLLEHDDIDVQRCATYLASELGVSAMPLLRRVIALLSRTEDRAVRYRALEVVVVCSEGELASEAIHLFRCFSVDDGVILRLAMRLASRTDDEQILAAMRECSDAENDRLHAEGLAVLLLGAEAGSAKIRKLIDSAVPLLRRYGAVAAARNAPRHLSELQFASMSQDDDVARFAGEFISEEEWL